MSEVSAPVNLLGDEHITRTLDQGTLLDKVALLWLMANRECTCTAGNCEFCLSRQVLDDILTDVNSTLMIMLDRRLRRENSEDKKAGGSSNGRT